MFGEGETGYAPDGTGMISSINNKPTASGWSLLRSVASGSEPIVHEEHRHRAQSQVRLLRSRLKI